MIIHIQLFGGGGGTSGGNFRGTTKAPNEYKPNSIYTHYKNGIKPF